MGKHKLLIFTQKAVLFLQKCNYNKKLQIVWLIWLILCKIVKVLNTLSLLKSWPHGECISLADILES